MAIDRADWHSGGDFSAELPSENGGTHIGMFLAWPILNGLQGEFHDEESSEDLEAVRGRTMTGRDFLFRSCDGKFWEEDLSEEGNKFAAAYYSGEGGQGYGEYIKDYQGALAHSLPSVYHVEDSWANYDVIAPVIDWRFSEWKAAHA
ncbi:DUF7832 domain-containing protein [Limnoglobus roseus]|uniref:DUF7832 domain-containing protein n=1 Tax=Limnoglobus roseus TaxID=2598579 RepID=A0A5C1A5Y5_9BACT|nr:hypothetical protein [Limnoglobus roseus]QEL13753.1 hypothetical protein PX52LOC_00611 [Limnoglobus roseus]